MLKLIRRLRFGSRYGCGRCHHSWEDHLITEKELQPESLEECGECNCKEYSIERVVWWKVLFGIY